MDPLVVTLELDAEHQQRFDAERAELFPRSPVGAHLTLFHAVPGERLERVLADVAAEADRPAFTLRVTEVMALGRGAAYRLEAPELVALHRRLQQAWADDLTRQDSQGLRPHVTVQNKATPEVARATLERLRGSFTPTTATADALAVWRYVGGPWDPVQRFSFTT
ncbi:2'-5' RNA ligase family protein [Nocardioides sp. CFH 31398]|uniref:2'-5' RNA ligase family protein n=1 Tax=Nocardioides sp. CFH 31398 TaxID=2919579 RepID=UPI001F067B3F|nr:2'-5' RNA ligase family protein [Nocardioides sp. CFH 31398]MCH1868518.1 2'-5' RNA ligase family protein [Nocardioides sp. CFH 31398]